MLFTTKYSNTSLNVLAFYLNICTVLFCLRPEASIRSGGQPSNQSITRARHSPGRYANQPAYVIGTLAGS